jgi:hypothetical protein
MSQIRKSGKKITEIRELKLHKSKNKSYKNLGINFFKNLRTEVTKIQKYGNKMQKQNFKILGTKVKKTGNKIHEQKFQKSRNKNLGTKITKIRELKL